MGESVTGWQSSYARIEERVRGLERWQESQNGDLEEIREMIRRLDERWERDIEILRTRLERLLYLLLTLLAAVTADVATRLFGG
jgi:hypothetical protein